MFETNTCATLIAREIAHLYAFLNSDAGHLCFAAIATWRAILYYCRRSRYPEASDLHSAMIAGAILTALIAAQEAQLSVRVKQVLSCKRPGIQEANLSHRAPPIGGDRNGFFSASASARAQHRGAHLRLREGQITHVDEMHLDAAGHRIETHDRV